jgi:hypothetical protein
LDYATEWIDNYAPDTRIIVKNDSGVGISRGDALMAVGATGDRIRVAKAVANGSVEPRYMLGLAHDDIANGAEGFLTMTGEVSRVNTASYSIGTVLYIDPDIAGALTTTEPSSPELVMPIAIVTRAHAVTGRLFVRMWSQQSGLHELHDVLTDTSPADNEVLAYDSASSLWKNQTAAEAGLVTTGNVDQTIDGQKTFSRIRLTPAVDLSTTSTDHNFQIGDSSSINLRMDNNEIECLNNGAGATLVLNGAGGGTVQFGGLLDSNDTYDNNITTTRRAMWMSSAGVFGYASSSRKTKQDIVDANLNVESILSIEPKVFRYIDAVESLGEDAPLELGMIAEDLHDAGLTHLVDYGKDGSVQGIHYSMYVTALQAVVRHQATQIADLSSRLEALESK